MALASGRPSPALFKERDIPAGMGNASAETKAAADYVTATNDEDGIVAALQHFEVIV